MTTILLVIGWLVIVAFGSFVMVAIGRAAAEYKETYIDENDPDFHPDDYYDLF